MKTQPDLLSSFDTVRAPLTLEPETAREVSTPQPQPDLLSVPPQPPAKTREDWERRQNGSFRARQMRRNILRKAGPTAAASNGYQRGSDVDDIEQGQAFV